MAENAIKVLLVEDNPGDARLLEEDLREVPGEEFELTHVERMEEASDRLREEEYDVVLLDLSLPDSSGLDTVKRTFSEAPTMPIVVLTGMDDESLGLSAVREGAQDYLVKGQTQGRMLVRAIHYALERERLQEEREQLIQELQEALATVKRLSGLLPICASCKRIRNDRGYWQQIEQYLNEHSEATFSHGLCPECARRLYPDLFEEDDIVDV
jgi:DNA-binding NtrC family response regulator